jgi:hypothetical protein
MKPASDMDPAPTFERLEERISRYITSTTSLSTNRWERWAIGLGFAAGGGGVAAATLIGGSVSVMLAVGGLLLELIALAVLLWSTFRQGWQTFHRHREQYARELDRDYVAYREMVDWLCSFPPVEVARRLRYIKDRKATLGYRVGLLTGNMDRLGVLPVLVVVYLQCKDWTFGDWRVLSHVSAVGGLLLWMLLIAYLGAWFMVGVKSRIDGYEALLAEAVASADAAKRKQADGWDGGV